MGLFPETLTTTPRSDLGKKGCEHIGFKVGEVTRLYSGLISFFSFSRNTMTPCPKKCLMLTGEGTPDPPVILLTCRITRLEVFFVLTMNDVNAVQPPAESPRHTVGPPRLALGGGCTSTQRQHWILSHSPLLQLRYLYLTAPFARERHCYGTPDKYVFLRPTRQSRDRVWLRSKAFISRAYCP